MDSSDEELVVVDPTADSQKRVKLVKKEKKDKKNEAGKDQKSKFQTISKNFAPNESPDEQHKYYYRAFIGGGFYVSLAKWLRNNQKYIQIRKSATSGANVPVENFRQLKAAINDLGANCPKLLKRKPN